MVKGSNCWYQALTCIANPVSTLTNPNIVNPYASPVEPTTYYVYGLAENCSAILIRFVLI